MPATVAFVSLGCAKNLVDSEKMLGLLAADGITPVPESDGADAIVINTCGFLEASKEESLEAIRDAVERKHAGQFRRVVVAGCLVQRHRAKILEWAPGVDALLGVFDRDRIVAAVRDGAPTRESSPSDDPHAPRYWIAGNALQAAQARGRDTVGLTVQGKDGHGIGYFEGDENRFRLTPRHWAYLRMSEGCNQRCAFCTIPSIRGKMRSKPPEALLAEARALLRDGAVELNLIGQDTTSYGMDIGYAPGLAGILRELDKVIRAEGGRWARLLYAYPTNFTDEMMDAIAALDSVAKYTDIPLQHASDSMLKAMRRGLTGQQQRQLIERLRQRIPGVTIRTTFISGFPGETQQDHSELLDFVESCAFEAVGVFKYSREEGTPAGTMELDPTLCVSDEVKAAREAEIMLLQQSIAFERAQRRAAANETVDVLVDGAAPRATKGRKTTGVAAATTLHTGRTQGQAPQVDALTYVSSAAAISPGEVVRCRIVEAHGYDLVARPEAEMQASHSLRVLRAPLG